MRRSRAQRRFLPGRTALASAAAAVAAMNPFSRFMASSFQGSAASPTAFIDTASPSFSFAQPTAGNRAAVTARSSLGNALAARFVAGSASHHISTRSASDWTFLHNDGAREVWAVWTPLAAVGEQTLLATRYSGAGTGIGQNGTSYSYDATTGPAFAWQGSGGALTPGAAVVTRASAAPSSFSMSIGSNVVASGAYLNAPVSSAPFGSLTVGACPNGLLPIDADIAEFLVFNRQPSAAEYAVFLSYAKLAYGV